MNRLSPRRTAMIEKKTALRILKKTWTCCIYYTQLLRYSRLIDKRWCQDQAHQDGFVHRGISCNKCHEEPIRGVRYHCLNCIDYDLCEYCEAEDAHFRHGLWEASIDIRTHVMIKIRVPTPSLVRRRPTELPMYPGMPSFVHADVRTDAECSSSDLGYCTISTTQTRDSAYFIFFEIADDRRPSCSWSVIRTI